MKAGKILNIPLIVTETNPDRLGPTAKDLDIKHAIGVYAKSQFSMLIPEVVEDLMKLNNIKTFVLFGLEGHICIEQTAMDLLREKYDVHIIADCVQSRTVYDRKLALKRLENMGCILTTYENTIFKLIKDKNHPNFNDIWKLFPHFLD